jgi:hypothetical protein
MWLLTGWPWLATIYPSLAFGVWHLCPLSVRPGRYPGGSVSSAVYTIALGLGLPSGPIEASPTRELGQRQLMTRVARSGQGYNASAAVR